MDGTVFHYYSKFEINSLSITFETQFLAKFHDYLAVYRKQLNLSDLSKTLGKCIKNEK